MAKFSIYSKDGSVIRFTGEPKYTGTYMGVPYVEFASIESPTPIQWQRGDYVDYYRTGLRYTLYSYPEPKKQSRRGEYGASFVYQNVKFFSAVKDLEIAPFRDLVPDDNNIHFSTRPEVNTYEDVYGIAARIQECMNDIFPNKWEIRVYDTSDSDLLALLQEQKAYSVSDGSCMDALSRIYESWKNVGWTHTYDPSRDKNIITIGRSSHRDEGNTSDVYAYGVGKGLTSIKKAAANEDEFATRLYVYGSDRNIHTRYYNELDIHNKDSVNIVNLMLPPEKWGKTNGKPDARKAYLQADDAIIEKYGLIPRTVYFDGNQNEEIYPSITGLTEADVRQAMIDSGNGNSQYLPTASNNRIDQVVGCEGYGNGDKETTEAVPNFSFSIRNIGFDIPTAAKQTPSEFAIISMISGACAGREFKVKKTKYLGEKTQTLELEKIWDESLGLAFPNFDYPINEGDIFVLLEVPMPDYYITLAQKRLLDAGEKMLADYTRVSAYYEPSIDSIKVKEGGEVLREGMYMQVYDKDIIDTEDNKDYVLIDTLTIDEKGALPKYQVTLREQKRSARTFGTLEDMIEDAKNVSSKEVANLKSYTQRRFQSALETIGMLQGAFTNFSEGISPVTVQTMSMLVGDESLQFKFTSSLNSLADIPCPLSYDVATKRLKASAASLIHMTLGIDSVTTKGGLTASDYLGWNLPSWNSIQFDDAEKKYYVYAKVSTEKGTTGTYILSENPIAMEGVNGYYHLMVGILNSEYSGERSFVTLYGYTEVLPGQITTDILRDSSGNLVIDLLNATITAKNGARIQGDITFGPASEGLSNVPEWKGLQDDIAEVEEIAKTANAATSTLDTKISDIETGVNKTIGEINARLDGVVENYFEEGAPSLTKKPVTEWETDLEKINHVGDTYTNIQEYVNDTTTPDAGKSWRWCWCEDSSIADKIEVTDKDGVKRYLHWHPIADSDAVKALIEASKAKTAADGKARTFVSQPKPPYSVGDLWVQGKEGGIMRCKVARATGSYTSSDWEVASNYTDDTTANEAQATANKAKEAADDAAIAASNASEAAANATAQAQAANTKLSNWASDSNISILELQGIKDEYAFVVADKNDILAQAAKYSLSVLLFELSCDSYIDKLSQIINAFDAATIKPDYVSIPLGLQEAQDSYYEARTTILDNIATKAKKVADDAQTAANTAKTAADDAAKAAKEAKDAVNDLKDEVADDYGYLHDTFGQVTRGQVFLGKLMGVGTGVDASINAYMDGSGLVTDSADGKLMLAIGIPTGSSTLATRAANASTRIYEKGKIITNDINLSGVISAKQGNVGLQYFDDEHYVSFRSNPESSWGITNIVQEGAGFSVVTQNASVTQKLRFGVGGLPNTGGNWFIEDKDGNTIHETLTNTYTQGGVIIEQTGFSNAALVIKKLNNTDSIAFDCQQGHIRVGQGMFEGLRPKTRILTSGDTLNQYDHTIIVNTSSSITINLPSAPLAGQTYRICKKYAGGNLKINGVTKNIRNLFTGNYLTEAGKETTSASKWHLTTNANMIDLVYDGTEWLAAWAH